MTRRSWFRLVGVALACSGLAPAPAVARASPPGLPQAGSPERLVVGDVGGTLSQEAGSRAAPPAPPLATLGVEALERGMRGVGYTVVEGTRPSPFEAEILGILEGAFPKQDLIVARLRGLGLEQSGVVAGMSGSPVFVDDRLIGAVAYRLVTAGHEAIAGIIPIGSMLEVAALGAAPPHAAGETVAGTDLVAVAAQLLAGRPQPEMLASLRAARPGLERIATPVAVSGLAPALVGRLAPLFEALGWQATLGGGSGSAPIEPYLDPGGIVAVQLVRGDLSVAASGTVTWRDDERILAFGHPFLQGGNVDYPLVAAEVITTLSSRQASSKLTTHGREVIGAIRQDRMPGILGAIGAVPRMVPVSARIERPGRDAEALAFEIVSDRNLTPLYLFFGLVNAIQSLDQVDNEDTIEVEGSIRLGGDLMPVRIGNTYSSQGQAIVSLGSTLAGIFSFLYANDLSPIEVADVAMTLRLQSGRRTATIIDAWLDRPRARPGDEVVVSVALQPYREASRVEQFRWVVPDDMAPGSVRLVVTAADGADRADPEMLGATQRPRDVAHAIALLNRARRNDRLYLQVTRAARGAVLDGRPLPALPPSRLAILESPRASGRLESLERVLLVEHERAVRYAVTGSHQVELTVEGS